MGLSRELACAEASKRWLTQLLRKKLSFGRKPKAESPNDYCRCCKQSSRGFVFSPLHATRAESNDVITMSSPPISILHRKIRCRYSNYRDVVASSPFPAPPDCPGELARRLLAATICDSKSFSNS